MQYLWLLWFVGPVLGIFAILEYYAVVHKKATLSRTVWKIVKAHPIFGVIFGLIVGGLIIHFFGWIPACSP